MSDKTVGTIRKTRVEFERVVYHFMDRGEQREAIFGDGVEAGQIRAQRQRVSMAAQAAATQRAGFPSTPYAVHVAVATALSSRRVLSPIFLAGTPAQISKSGIDFVTTAPAPTTAPSPILTPFRTTTFTPSQTSSPRTIAASAPGCWFMGRSISTP